MLQYAIQVQQLADAIRNTAHGGPASLTGIAADLNQLANVVQGGTALAYSLAGQDVVFRQTFPGYQPVFGPAPAAGTYESQYSKWAQTSLATTQGILRGVGLQGKLLATEQGVLSILRTLTASNLLDRIDAINLTGQLAAEQVGQLVLGGAPALTGGDLVTTGTALAAGAFAVGSLGAGAIASAAGASAAGAVSSTTSAAKVGAGSAAMARTTSEVSSAASATRGGPLPPLDRLGQTEMAQYQSRHHHRTEGLAGTAQRRT